MDSKMGTGETGWNNGLSGGDVAAVVLYFILVLGIGLYVSRHHHHHPHHFAQFSQYQQKLVIILGLVLNDGHYVRAIS